MSRDHLDAGSVAQPTRETENMLDGSDAVADWPVLNALVNTAAGGDLVALHQGGGSGMGGSVSAGLTIIIDGTDRTQGRLDRVLRTDPGLGVIRHADAGYLRAATADTGEAVRLVNAAAADGEALSVALHANAADALPRLHETGLRPDVVTDQTAAHDALDGYIPAGYTVGEATALRSRDPDRYQREALASIRTHLAAMLAYQDTGSVVFEYGNAIREQAARAGHDGAFGFSGFVPLYIRPNLCVARGACRWLALSGDPADIETIDRAMLERFAGDASVTDWIGIAMARVPHQGLPARTSWLDYRQRLEFATMVNGLVAAGALAAPVAMSRDHLDAGSVAQPTRETENMLDGSDAVADWPVLNALVNTAAGGDLVALHQGGGSGMGGSVSAGLTIVIDGTDRTQARLDRVLRTDPGLGVIRHADAGYPASLAAVAENGLAAPMLPGAGHPA
jgi:urocanate hydratase